MLLFVMCQTCHSSCSMLPHIVCVVHVCECVCVCERECVCLSVRVGVRVQVRVWVHVRIKKTVKPRASFNKTRAIYESDPTFTSAQSM